MKSKKLEYIFKQAFQSMWRNRMMGLASIGSVAAVLVILGYILMLVLNINNIALTTKEQFDEIAVYIKDEVSDDKINEIGEEIKKLDGVLAVGFVPREQALENLKEEWGEDASLLDGLRTNPLPNTIVVQLKDVIYSENIISTIKSYDEVEDISYYQDAVKSLIAVSDVIKKVGMVIITILILISIFIISNTVKITVMYRRKEIELMQYIGATNGYVRGPFVIEGVMLGIVGALIAMVVILLSYNYLADFMSTKYLALLAGYSSYLVDVTSILSDILIIFMTIGIGIGSLGSLISLKKFLNA